MQTSVCPCFCSLYFSLDSSKIAWNRPRFDLQQFEQAPNVTACSKLIAGQLRTLTTFAVLVGRIWTQCDLPTQSYDFSKMAPSHNVSKSCSHWSVRIRLDATLPPGQQRVHHQEGGKARARAWFWPALLPAAPAVMLVARDYRATDRIFPTLLRHRTSHRVSACVNALGAPHLVFRKVWA